MTPTLDVTGYRVQSAEYETIETGDVSTKMTAPDGTVTTMSHLPEARWGTLAPMTTVKVESGGYTSEVAVTRTPSLATPGDPTSLQTLETDVTVDGDTWTTYLDLTKLTEATYFETRTSPELRTLLRLRRGRAPATVTGPAQVGLGP